MYPARIVGLGISSKWWFVVVVFVVELADWDIARDFAVDGGWDARADGGVAFAEWSGPFQRACWEG